MIRLSEMIIIISLFIHDHDRRMVFHKSEEIRGKSRLKEKEERKKPVQFKSEVHFVGHTLSKSRE